MTVSSTPRAAQAGFAIASMCRGSVPHLSRIAHTAAGSHSRELLAWRLMGLGGTYCFPRTSGGPPAHTPCPAWRRSGCTRHVALSAAYHLANFNTLSPCFPETLCFPVALGLSRAWRRGPGGDWHRHCRGSFLFKRGRCTCSGGPCGRPEIHVANCPALAIADGFSRVRPISALSAAGLGARRREGDLRAGRKRPGGESLGRLYHLSPALGASGTAGGTGRRRSEAWIRSGSALWPIRQSGRRASRCWAAGEPADRLSVQR